MTSKVSFDKHEGLLCVLVENPKWPSPANFYIVPLENGFGMIDVGCGGFDGGNLLKAALSHWGLLPHDCRTVVLSHAHPDHMGGIEWLLRHAQPNVFIHSSDVKGALEPAHLNATFDIPFASKTCESHPGFEGFSGLDILDYFLGTGCTMSCASRVEPLEEGDRLSLGKFDFEVLHTPGHSPGHIALYDSEKGLLLPGDMVGAIPAWYTPSSGGYIGYLQSLDKLEAAKASCILPSHGPIIPDPDEIIKWVRDKLRARETRIIDILSEGEQAFMQLVAALFPTPFVQFFPGCGIIESHLQKLEGEGSISRQRQNGVITIKE